MRERDTKIGLAEQRQVAFLEIAFQILPLKSKQKRAPQEVNSQSALSESNQLINP